MKYLWMAILECDDDDDNPTVWATEINSERYGKYVWIEKYDEDEFHITINDYEWRTLKICKSLTSAKRWVSMNL